MSGPTRSSNRTARSQASDPPLGRDPEQDARNDDVPPAPRAPAPAPAALAEDAVNQQLLQEQQEAPAAPNHTAANCHLSLGPLAHVAEAPYQGIGLMAASTFSSQSTDLSDGPVFVPSTTTPQQSVPTLVSADCSVRTPKFTKVSGLRPATIYHSSEDECERPLNKYNWTAPPKRAPEPQRPGIFQQQPISFVLMLPFGILTGPYNRKDLFDHRTYQRFYGVNSFADIQLFNSKKVESLWCDLHEALSNLHACNCKETAALYGSVYMRSLAIDTALLIERIAHKLEPHTREWMMRAAFLLRDVTSTSSGTDQEGTSVLTMCEYPADLLSPSQNPHHRNWRRDGGALVKAQDISQTAWDPNLTVAAANSGSLFSTVACKKYNSGMANRWRDPDSWYTANDLPPCAYWCLTPEARHPDLPPVSDNVRPPQTTLTAPQASPVKDLPCEEAHKEDLTEPHGVEVTVDPPGTEFSQAFDLLKHVKPTSTALLRADLTQASKCARLGSITSSASRSGPPECVTGSAFIVEVPATPCQGLAVHASRYCGTADPADYMLKRSMFALIDKQLGPHTVDAAARGDGTNAQLDYFCSKEGLDFFVADLCGQMIWVNPPYRALLKWSHRLKSFVDSDPSTGFTFVAPDPDPTEPWVTLLKSLKARKVSTIPEGSLIFTRPSSKPGHLREPAGPCPFPVSIWHRPSHGTWESSPKTGSFQLPKPPGKASLATRPHSGPYIDSGANFHMTPVLEYLHQLRPVGANEPSEIKVGSGELLPVLAVGSLTLLTNLEEGPPTVTLKRVLYMPSLTATLYSVSEMTKRGALLSFTNQGCTIQVRGQVLLRSQRENGLDLVPSGQILKKFESPQAATKAARAAGFALLAANLQRAMDKSPAIQWAELWHSRLGHLGTTSLQRVTTMVDGLNVKPEDFREMLASRQACHHCLMARLPRGPRPPRVNTAKSKLERLWCDLIGPFKPADHKGHLYLMVVVDEYTKYSALHLLVQKSEAAQHVLNTIRHLERQTGARVVHLRSDGGGEFISNEFKQELSNMGIQLELTARDCSASNGQAERCIRTILEKVRSLLSDGQVPRFLWGDAAIQANLLRNISPVSTRTETPWELMFGTRPDLSGLRRFGCLCYVHTPIKVRETKKLAPTAEPGIHLGSHYLDSKMYRVYVEGRVRLARDVKFDELYDGWPALNGIDPEDPDFDNILAERIKELTPTVPTGPVISGADIDRSDLTPQPVQDDFSSDDDDAPVAPNSLPVPSSRALVPAPRTLHAPALPPVGPGGHDVLSGELEDPESEKSYLPDESGPSTDESPGYNHLQPYVPSTSSSSDEDPDDDDEFMATSPVPAGPLRRSRRVRVTMQRFTPGAYSAVSVPRTTDAPLEKEPETFKQAMDSPQAAQWRQAMQAEMDALQGQGTWVLVPRPKDSKVLPNKWVYKAKRALDGSIERFKARLVVGGHRQKYDFDYAEVFAPVARAATLRALLAITASQDWELYALDISNAFLHGEHGPDRVHGGTPWVQDPREHHCVQVSQDPLRS